MKLLAKFNLIPSDSENEIDLLLEALEHLKVYKIRILAVFCHLFRKGNDSFSLGFSRAPKTIKAILDSQPRPCPKFGLRGCALNSGRQEYSRSNFLLTERSFFNLKLCGCLLGLGNNIWLGLMGTWRTKFSLRILKVPMFASSPMSN